MVTRVEHFKEILAQYSISKEDADTLVAGFARVLDSFDASFPNRTRCFFSYNYVLNRLAHHHGIDLGRAVRLVTSRDKVEESERLWDQVSAHC